ncbi:TetR/AcrR family transcriptional regulator C-terminal domain-containing protein [Streptomyces sp. NPDC057555]|uniref:TetR/AcrR family transcriptional regulator C-terminal domain-containing protein n=1 Tax=Streptomyces sp. NPDC057555 TaxID=3346166 RepID=UPI0036B26344
MPGNRTRGQRAGLTRQSILEAALALADREGLKALSMRRLGAELGVEAMTLYHHVASKDALLDGVVEQVFAEVAPPRFQAASWRADLRDYAGALLTALLAHPNVVPLVVSRPATTPRNLQAMENALASLRTAGFPLDRALDVLYAISGFVVGHVAAEVDPARRDDRRTATDRLHPLLDLDPDEFPLLTAAARTERPRSGADSRFDFALEAMLAGFDAARRPES